MQKGSEQLLLITSYNGVYQEDYKIPIHSLWHAVEVLPQPSYVTSSCKSAIASLLFCSAPKLTIRMMDVETQQNGPDCGILSIAYAYDICSGKDPCKVVYDHLSIRSHLAKCLEAGKFSCFPVLRERESKDVKHIQEIQLYCTCRLPEEEDVDKAKCVSCGMWFHRHCVDIPKKVFARRDI